MSTQNSIDMLARLVAFPTVSRDSNLPLIDWVEEELAGITNTPIINTYGIGGAQDVTSPPLP